jgi:crotonobetainyl-CoA:carnitine CoA-transferase CaiB-like acyl-CoA transferase
VSEPGTGPLAGVRVCDLSTVLAGPYCAMLLADLGADVVKVEPPTGDPTRQYGPPWAGAADPERGYMGESAYYLSINRNKRGIRLDLRQAAGQEVLRRLLGRSDVLIENFRPGGLARLGFPDDALEALNLRLVRLSITGYGSTGPDRDRPGFDFIIQAVSGLMSITGQPDEDGGEPTKVGVAITDLATGMLGAVSVLASLRERDQRSGHGQRIDLSLLDSTVSWLANQAGNYLVGGEVPGRMGNRHPNVTPYETLRTSDGEIAIAVGSERQWLRLCAALGVPELASDPRFDTNGDRVRNRDVLRPLVAEAVARRSTGEWLAALDAADVPVGPVRDLDAVFADPQVAAREMVVAVDHPTIGELRLPGIPYKLSATPGSIRRPPPLLGEHTDEILAELGFRADDIAKLRGSGAV